VSAGVAVAYLGMPGVPYLSMPVFILEYARCFGGELAVSLKGAGRVGRVLRVSALCVSPVSPPAPLSGRFPMSQNSCTDLSYIRSSCTYAHQCCSSLSRVLTSTLLCDKGSVGPGREGIYAFKGRKCS
jgi:hypothetical protein